MAYKVVALEPHPSGVDMVAHWLLRDLGEVSLDEAKEAARKVRRQVPPDNMVRLEDDSGQPIEF
jgi:hypothetical protein